MARNPNPTRLLIDAPLDPKWDKALLMLHAGIGLGFARHWIEPLTATGFLRTTADITDNQTIYEVDKYFDAQQKAMETSLSAVMGLTVQCARCHDHKFDPILQRDYYKLMAVYQAVWDPENWLPADLNHVNASSSCVRTSARPSPVRSTKRTDLAAHGSAGRVRKARKAVHERPSRSWKPGRPPSSTTSSCPSPERSSRHSVSTALTTAPRSPIRTA